MKHKPPPRFAPVIVLALAILGSAWWWTTTLRATSTTLTASGTIEIVDVRISPELGGRVIIVNRAQGDTVNNGDVLVQLDTEMLQAQRGQAVASVNLAQAGQAVAQAGYAAAKAGLHAAQATHGDAGARLAAAQSGHAVTQAQLAAARAGHAIAQANAKLVAPQTAVEATRANLGAITAQQQLNVLYADAGLNMASIESEIARARIQLEEAERALEVVAKPDFKYYQNRVTQAQRNLQQLHHAAEVIALGGLTDAVDIAEDLLEDEQDFLEKVEKAIEGCKVDVETGTHTKLTFSETLTYRNETYVAGVVYDIPNWKADELLADYSSIAKKADLTCDPEREVTVEGRLVTLADARDAYADAVTRVDAAEHALQQAQLANDEALRDAQNVLERAQRDLDWAHSGEYSKQAIQAAERQSATDLTLPQSLEVANTQAQADVVLAQATLAEAQDRYVELQDGVDPDALELTQAQLAQAEASSALASAHAQEQQTAAQAQLDAALAQVEAAQAQVESAQAQVAIAQAQVDGADAGVEAAHAQLDSSQAQLDAARGQVQAAQAAVDVIDVQINKSTLAAPVDGVVLSRSVQPGEMAMPGATLLTIGKLDDLTITVYVPEDRYGAITLGQEATVRVDSFPRQAFSASVQRIADKAEFTPRNVQTAEGRAATVFAIELEIHGGRGKLKPGMPADVAFQD
jgi:HlyD family secretion protein